MPRSITAAAAALIALTGAAAAQEWPTRPITLVVPFAAGGGIDVSVRMQAQHMSELLGQSFVVENIGGAAGTAGSQRVAKAAPDGYTLLIGNTGTHAYSQSLYKRPLYNAATDFTPVGLVSESPRILMARKDLPASNLQEFIAYAEGQPGEDAVRLGRRRLRHASALRPAQSDAQGQHHACALSRRRPGDAGPDRRPHRLLLRHDPDRRAAGQAGDGERHRRDGAEARADHRGPGDHRRAGRAGRRGDASGTRSSFPRERRSRSCASSTRR